MTIVPVNFSLKSRIDESYDNKIRSIVGNDLYFGIEDIVINGERVQTAEDRRHQIEQGADNLFELKEIYSLEKSVEEIGRRLNFPEKGSYDSIHLVWLMSKNSKQLKDKLTYFKSENIKTMSDYCKFIDDMLSSYFGVENNGIFREQTRTSDK